MRSFKKIGALALVVAAFSALGVASASAAQFTYSQTGSLTGSALEDHVFNTGAGEVVCKKAAMTGTITSTSFTAQHVTVKYSECKAFNIATVDISDATYNFTASGQVHIVNPITITVTGFLIECTLTVPVQTVGTVDYVNDGASLIFQPTVSGVTSAGSGGLCGGHNSNGTYTGRSTVRHSVSGQTVGFDP